MQILVLFVVSTLFLDSHADASSQDIVMKDLSGTDYFSYFDYSVAENKRAVFQFEKKMVERALVLENYLDQDPDYRPERQKYSGRKNLALNWVYTAMFILNNCNGAREGYYDYQDLTSEMRFGIGSDVRGEMLARIDFAIRLLKRARATYPEDDRIDSWYAAAVMEYQWVDRGQVDEETLDWITDNATRDPMFHLFSALKMNSEYDFGRDREARLMSKVDYLNSKESPCRKIFFRTGESKKCNTTKKTPFAYQGVTVFMGDYYLKEAARLFSTNPQASAAYSTAASRLYTRVDWFIFKPKAKRWKQIGNLPERKRMAQDLSVGVNSVGDFFQSRRYLDSYTCVSCHQGGKDERVLDVRLPSLTPDSYMGRVVSSWKN